MGHVVMNVGDTDLLPVMRDSNSRKSNTNDKKPEVNLSYFLIKQRPMIIV
jgi:hypothetical protein